MASLFEPLSKQTAKEAISSDLAKPCKLPQVRRQEPR